MDKIAVVGARDVVLGFKALGMEAVYAQTPTEASHAVNGLARSGCAIIFVTEALLGEMSEVIDRYKNASVPAIIPIPGNNGSMGLGMQWVRENVEKAVGSNILLNDKEGEDG